MYHSTPGSLSIINSWSSPKLMCIESVMPSSHLILCRPFSSCPQSLPASVFFNESTLRMRWPKYWPILITYLYLFCTFLICLFWYPFWSSSNISCSFLLQELCLCFFFCRQTLDYVKCPMLSVPCFFLLKNWLVCTFTFLCLTVWFISNTSVQFSRSVVSNSLWPHESQHARPPCPSPTPGVHPNSCALNRWCHPAISSSVVPFSSFTVD